MNRFVWNLLGGLTLLAALYMLSQIPERLKTLPATDHAKLIIGTTVFMGILGVIASTCFFPKSRFLTLRILGAIGVAGCLFNLVQGFQTRNFSQFPLILIFWLPGSIYLILKGKMSDQQ